MELQSIVWIFVVFFVGKLKATKMCGKNQYRILKNNSTLCLPCQHCVHGQGLDPPCGRLLNHPPQIECFECQLGISYSDEHGPSSCKKCSYCSPHEIITKNCTVESDTICSHTCEPGFYYDNSSHNCQACSFCCGDGSDIHIAVCKSSPKQCSFHNGNRCAPVTPIATLTTTTATPVNKTTPAKGHKNTIIASSIAGSLVSIIIVIILIYCHKKRKEQRRRNIPKQNNLAAVVENGAAQPLRCGLEEMNFRLRIQNYHGPIQKTKLLTHESELLLEVFCENDNDNRCFGHCTFKWKKDGTELKYEEQNILKNERLTIVDSGNYQCFLHCPRHEQDKESEKIKIHVGPSQDEDLKLLQDISLDKKQEIETSIKIKLPDVGNWQNIGNHYGMDPTTLASMNDDNNKAEQVINRLFSAHPELTVFDFCEYLKTINQNNLVTKLSKDLTVPKKGGDPLTEADPLTDDSLNDTRDSGIDFEFPLKVRLPEVKKPDTVYKHIMMNAAYSDSSREGSLDELPTSKKMVKKMNGNTGETEENNKKKRSFNRQESNQSSKSAGNMSLNSIKNAVSNAVSKKLPRRQTSYLEHKVDDDTDDSEV